MLLLQNYIKKSLARRQKEKIMIRSGREAFYAESVNLTKVEKTLPDGSCGTLLAEITVVDTETARLAHAFLADLAGARRMAQDKMKNELIHKFMKLAFDKVVEKIGEEPFESYHVVSITGCDKDKIDIKNIYSLLSNTDTKSVINEINERCKDLNIEVVYIKPEKWGSGNYYIPLGIRFND